MSLFKRRPKPTNIINKSSFEKRKWIGILIILLSFIFAFVLIPMLNSQKSETEKIAVAKVDIKRGSTISKENFEFVERGIYGVKDYITDPENIMGKTVAMDIAKGDTLTSNKIGKENMSKIQSLLLEQKSLTTITIKTNAAGLSSHLKPGDKVRIYNVAEDEYNGTLMVQQDPLLNGIEVYDIENSNTESLETTKKETNGNKDNIASTITFITDSKEQESALIKAEYSGSIHVALIER